MSVTANNIQGGLQVYSFKSFPAFASLLPPRGIISEDFDESVSSAGQTVTSNINTSQFGTLNNLANGWETMQVTSSIITATLQLVGHDYAINLQDFDTIGQAKIVNTFGNIVGQQTANGVSVQLYNNITSSYFKNTVTIPSSSQFVYAAPTSSLTQINAVLDGLEIPAGEGERYVLTNPTMKQSMKASNNLFQTLTFGTPQIVQGGGYGPNGHFGHPRLHVDGADILTSTRLYGATKPYGGDSYSNSDKLVGFGGHKTGLMAAARATNAFDGYPGVYTYTYIEPSSGWPFLYLAALDMSKPVWRFGVYTLFGSAAANPNAIVPILTASN